MPFDPAIAERLRHIIDNIDAIESYVERLSVDQFAQDNLRVDAVERCLQRITEAAIWVGEARMAIVAPQLPFADVRGLGNTLRHEYHKLDMGTIWRTITDDLPGLRAACLAALQG